MAENQRITTPKEIAEALCDSFAIANNAPEVTILSEHTTIEEPAYTNENPNPQPNYTVDADTLKVNQTGRQSENTAIED